MFPCIVAIIHAIALLSGSDMLHYRVIRGCGRDVDELCSEVQKGTPAQMLPNLAVTTHDTEL